MSKVHSCGQWAAINCAVPPTVSAGQYTQESHSSQCNQCSTILSLISQECAVAMQPSLCSCFSDLAICLPVVSVLLVPVVSVVYY